MRRETQALEASRRLNSPRAQIWDATTVETAVRCHDRMVASIEAKWGSLERLISIVQPETGARFRSAEIRRDDALLTGTEDEIIKRVNVAWKGMMALDEEAERLGHATVHLDRFWSCSDAKGNRYVIVQNDEDTVAASKDERFKGARCVSTEEIMRVLGSASLIEALKVKDVFPEATITSIAQRDVDLDDEIPF